MTILVTRLLTGEEILGDVDVVDSDTVRIENPTQIAAAPNQQTGSVDVHMAPFAPLAADKYLVIRVNNILCQYEPIREIVNKYNKLFGSGLILPTNTGISTVS